MKIEISKAAVDEVEIVRSILLEAAEWLANRNEKLWDESHLRADDIRRHVESGMYWIAAFDGEPAGCFRFQESDPEYWGDVPHEDSAFIHKVAVRRKFSGGTITKAMLDFAKRFAKDEGKRFLRLDCGQRPKLKNVYERSGFVFHSEKVREPYNVDRYQFDLLDYKI